MSHEEFVRSIHGQITETAQAMLNREISFLAGTRRLAALRHDAQVRDDDPDFMVFVAIDSDTDALPIGAVRAHWHKDALARLEPEIQATEAWAFEQGAAACASLITRFGEQKNASN